MRSMTAASAGPARRAAGGRVRALDEPIKSGTACRLVG
jgi:hypothetical protein